MMRLSAHGLDVDVAPGWEARILRREAQSFGEQPRPVVHLANFPLPEHRDDFGAGVVETMRGRDLFVVIFEYESESVHQPLFRHRGLPRLVAADFSARRLQRTLPGQAGAQVFFAEAGRAFCLYVVVADGRQVRRAVATVNATVAKFGIAPR
jgi:hypothetical protein